jgi:hypothetical protein
MTVSWALRVGCAVYAPLDGTRTLGLTVRAFRDWGSGLGIQDLLRG